MATDPYANTMVNPLPCDWYLKEWLASKNASNTWFEAQTGYTHRIASQLINRKIRWNQDHLALAATVLQIHPYELLMHPEDAMAMRRLRQTALQIAADNKREYVAQPMDFEDGDGTNG